MTAQKPKLRFPEFSDSWEEKKIKDLLNRESEPVEVEQKKTYQQIGIRSHGKGLFHKELVTGRELGNKRVFWVKDNLFIVNIVFAWEQAVATTTQKEVGMIASHRFPMFSAIENQADINYLLHFFLTEKGKALLELASPGGAGRNKTLGQKEFDNLKLTIPNQKEQTKIAHFLTIIDKKINLLKEKKSHLEAYKKGIMQQIFNQKIRFKKDDGSEFEDWEEKSLGEISIIKSGSSNRQDSSSEGGEYTFFDRSQDIRTSDIYLFDCEAIIVAGEGQDFIPKYFKGKFDLHQRTYAITNFEHNGKYLFFYIFHNRIYFLSQAVGSTVKSLRLPMFEKMKIKLPPLEEQQKIASFLSAIDEKITSVSNAIESTQTYKKGLLQQMFC